MIKRNEEFTCIKCGYKNPIAKKTCRNHCLKCLYSLHVDNIPGDRSNNCKGLMEPIDITYNSKKGYMIIHKCKKCNIIKINKTATDDDIKTIISIMKKSLKK